MVYQVSTVSCVHVFLLYLKAEVASLLHKGGGVMLPTPGATGPHNGLVQPWHKVCQVASGGAGSWHAAVEPLLSRKLIYVAHELDRHLQARTKNTTLSGNDRRDACGEFSLLPKQITLGKRGEREWGSN